MELSLRLRTITELLDSSDTLADVGCDHGYVSIWLVQNGKFKRALAMDVRKGPLAIASSNITNYNLTNSIETRLSDGLVCYNIGEADSLVIAGMGGILIQKILSKDEDKSRSFTQMLLQPQSEIGQVRAYVRELGYFIDKEAIVFEDGKYYPMFHLTKTEPDDNVRERVKADLTALINHSYLALIKEYQDTVYPDETVIRLDVAEDVINLYGEYLLFNREASLRDYLLWQKGVLADVDAKIRGSIEAAGNIESVSPKLKNRYNEHLMDKLFNSVALTYLGYV